MLPSTHSYGYSVTPGLLGNCSCVALPPASLQSCLIALRASVAALLCSNRSLCRDALVPCSTGMCENGPGDLVSPAHHLDTPAHRQPPAARDNMWAQRHYASGFAHSLSIIWNECAYCYGESPLSLRLAGVFLRMRILIIGVSLMLMACQAPDQGISGDGEQANIKQWRMVMDLPGGGTPVNLEITDDELPTVTLVNGIEKVKVPQVTRVADGLMLRFPAFNNQLHLKPTENGYQGHLKLVKQGYFQSIPLTLTPEQQYRFTESPVPEIDVTGRWGVTFVDDEGKESFAVGEFDQQGGQLTGTFLTALGDYRFLAGDVDGRNMKLSTFDGAHAFLFTATMDEGGILSGDFWSGTRWHESWTPHCPIPHR